MWKVPFEHPSGRTNKNHEIFGVHWLRFEPRTFRIQARSVTALANLFGMSHLNPFPIARTSLPTKPFIFLWFQAAAFQQTSKRKFCMDCCPISGLRVKPIVAAHTALPYNHKVTAYVMPSHFSFLRLRHFPDDLVSRQVQVNREFAAVYLVCLC